MPPLRKIIFIKLRYYLIILACVFCVCPCGCRSFQNSQSVTVAFYNCENFFDTSDAPETQDDEFTPCGKYGYTREIYEQKTHHLAMVIESMAGKMPALIGLAEVENSGVLNELCAQPEIARQNYRGICANGSDKRGINVALMYQEGLFRPISAKQIAVAMGDDNAATRNILYVQGVLAGDTVHVFVNHWPSRRTENVANTLGDPRLRAAQVLRRALVEVYSKAPKADIIVLGDFNDNPSDSSLQLLSGDHAELFNPFAKLYSPDSVGTEAYGGQWNLFDQVLMSRSFLASGGDKLSFRAAQIFKPAFLLNRQGEPRRSFIGAHWANGYSDHLPVLVEFGWVARN